jgi:hypothetical protein
MQLLVSSPGFEILEFFLDVDLGAALLSPVGIACSRTGRFSLGSIVVPYCQLNRSAQHLRESDVIHTLHDAASLVFSESAFAEFSFFYTKSSSFHLYIQTYPELAREVTGYPSVGGGGSSRDSSS